MGTEAENIVNEMAAQFGTEMANIPERTSEQLPKMKAVFKVENAFLNRSQSSNRKQLSISAIIVESNAGEEFIGKKYRKNWGLETADNLSWLKKDMKALELEAPNTPQALVTITEQLNGICFTGSLVPNQDEAFPPNCFINAGARRHDLEGNTAATETAVGSNI
ncbi:hypothetical protein LCGC14_0613100 [marine sediment metagenome]|uniref:Uncharacterized protein n=1 Tax=marine sediment metagenome TaxID=412755 RepID=A0A0F9UFM5_9ZZZZ